MTFETIRVTKEYDVEFDLERNVVAINDEPLERVKIAVIDDVARALRNEDLQ